jgi:hypothetical protein
MKTLLLKMSLLLATCAAAHASTIYSFDTTGLTGPGPFAIGFQLIDGGVLSNNTVTLSNFTFGGGSAGAVQSSTAASGNIGSTVTLDNSAFLGEFIQNFTPGTTLSFRFSTTNNSDGATPDEWSVFLLNGGTQIATTDAGGTFAYVDLTGATLDFSHTFSSNTGIPGGLNIAAPTVSQVSSGAPEPATFLTLVPVLLGLLIIGRRKAVKGTV